MKSELVEFDILTMVMHGGNHYSHSIYIVYRHLLVNEHVWESWIKTL